METILIRYISNYLSNEVVEIEELMEIKQLIQRQKIERMMKVHKEMRGLDRYREQPKEYKYIVVQLSRQKSKLFIMN